ncbi:MAG: hypothetical protein P8101_18550 [Candidatus Thiodiazotropha sp.]
MAESCRLGYAALPLLRDSLRTWARPRSGSDSANNGFNLNMLITGRLITLNSNGFQHGPLRNHALFQVAPQVDQQARATATMPILRCRFPSNRMQWPLPCAPVENQRIWNNS